MLHQLSHHRCQVGSCNDGLPLFLVVLDRTLPRAGDYMGLISTTVHLLSSIVMRNFSVTNKKYLWLCSDMNQGLLAEKRERYLWAMAPPTDAVSSRKMDWEGFAFQSWPYFKNLLSKDTSSQSSRGHPASMQTRLRSMDLGSSFAWIRRKLETAGPRKVSVRQKWWTSVKDD